MGNKVKRGSIGVKVFAAMLLMLVIIAFTVVSDIGALGRIGDYNEVIAESCLAMERINGELGEALQKIQMYVSMLFYEQVGETAQFYQSVVRSAAEEVQDYSAELQRLAQVAGDESLIAISDAYLQSVTQMSACAGRLVAAAEQLDRATFMEEAALLTEYINDMTARGGRVRRGHG